MRQILKFARKQRANETKEAKFDHLSLGALTTFALSVACLNFIISRLAAVDDRFVSKPCFAVIHAKLIFRPRKARVSVLVDKDAAAAAESFVYPYIMRVLLQDIATGYA